MDSEPKPDFRAGVAADSVAEGSMLSGTVGGEDALLIRRGGEYFAVGAYCSHYHGALARGLVVGDTIRCPLHHACFRLRDGAVLRAPALDPIRSWKTETIDGTVFVREDTPAAAPRALGQAPSSIVIVGGGAAGLAAAAALRSSGYPGGLTMISADASPPCDRPNLSKDYLAGTAPPEWIPLRPPEFYTEQKIDLILGAQVAGLDTAKRRVRIENGKSFDYDALLLATGAAPVRLDIPGATQAQVYYLRTFADSSAIVERAAGARRVVVVGASFIGLEVAASLRARNIDVHVVAPERVPMTRILGEPFGRFILGLHESHGVRFHPGNSVRQVEGRQVVLQDGTILDADFLVIGVGVRPMLGLAEGSGLAVDRGVLVDEYLQTSAPHVFAAGDIARWPDPHSGDRIRVEHWVVAQRQGQVAAMNMLGLREKFTAVPFFWSQHYDLTINYVGHAEHWDQADLEGAFESRNFSVTYRDGGRTLAVASVGRDRQNLQAELSMEAKP